MVNITISGSAEEVFVEMSRLCILRAVPAEIEKPAKASKPTPPTAPPPTVPTSAPAAPTGSVTLADIQSDIPKLAAKMGKDKTVEMLGRYGAKKGSEIKPEDFEKFHTEAKGLLG